MPEQLTNLRDIPNLDDRLVRFLELLQANINQLMSLHQQNATAISSTSSSIPNSNGIRNDLEAAGIQPLNVENLRGKLAQSQLANIPRLSTLPALSDISYEDGDCVSVSSVIYIRNRSIEPGSWDAISALAVGANPSFTTVDVSVEYKQSGQKVVSSRGGIIADPAGGATIDVESRAAISSILSRLRASTGHGLIGG